MWFDRRLSADTQPKMTAVEIFKRRKEDTVIKFSFPRKVLSLTGHCCLCEKFSFSCTGGVESFKINLDANMLSRVFFENLGVFRIRRTEYIKVILRIVEVRLVLQPPG